MIIIDYDAEITRDDSARTAGPKPTEIGHVERVTMCQSLDYLKKRDKSIRGEGWVGVFQVKHRTEVKRFHLKRLAKTDLILRFDTQQFQMKLLDQLQVVENASLAPLLHLFARGCWLPH